MNSECTSPSFSRRHFLQAGSVAVVGGLTSGLSSASTGQEISRAQEPSLVNTFAQVPIVDTHQHLWDLNVLTLPWLSGAPETLQHSFVMSDYQKATSELNLTKSIYMEVNVSDDQKEKEAAYVIGLAQQEDNPLASAIIGGSPHTTEFATYAKKHAQSQYVSGIRNVLHDPDRPQGMCLEPTFVKNMQLLGELGLTFDLCMRPSEISDAVTLAKKCPDTQFIVDHCGNMPVKGYSPELLKSWQEAMKAAADLKNVACKISGIVVTAEKGNWTAANLAPQMNFCMETFGEDRIVFGGDWPVCTLTSTYQQWAEALFEIVKDRPTAFQKKLFHDNALKIYGIG